MWIARKISNAVSDLSDRSLYTGKVPGNDISKIGRALKLRNRPDKEYDKLRSTFGHMGPFLPVIYEACQEDQLAEEYQHGVTSFGAFTYCVTQTLREARNSGKEITFQELLDRTSKRLDDMGYIQKPAILGPDPILGAAVPQFKTAQVAVKKPGKRK